MFGCFWSHFTSCCVFGRAQYAASAGSCSLEAVTNCYLETLPCETWQRFCTQHSVKLGKLENIFLTQLHADTLGGLLGMYLTLADSGNRRLLIHGPPGVSHFLGAGKAFCENRQDSELRAAEISLSNPADSLFRDNLVSIQPVAITPSFGDPATVSGGSDACHHLPDVGGGRDGEEEGDADEDGDAGVDPSAAGAGHEPPLSKEQDSDVKLKKSERRHRGSTAPYSAASVSYVLRFADQAGRLDVSKAVSLGVPKGPMLGKLKGGQAVTLPDGRVVEPSACVEGGTTGSVVVLLACPSLQHVAPLVSHHAWNALPPAPTDSPLAQGGVDVANGGAGHGRPVHADLVVHFGGQEVLCDKRYVELTQRISGAKHTTHILLHQSVCEPEVVFPSQVRLFMLQSSLCASITSLVELGQCSGFVRCVCMRDVVIVNRCSVPVAGAVRYLLCVRARAQFGAGVERA